MSKRQREKSSESGLSVALIPERDRLKKREKKSRIGGNGAGKWD